MTKEGPKSPGSPIDAPLPRGLEAGPISQQKPPPVFSLPPRPAPPLSPHRPPPPLDSRSIDEMASDARSIQDELIELEEFEEASSIGGEVYGRHLEKLGKADMRQLQSDHSEFVEAFVEKLKGAAINNEMVRNNLGLAGQDPKSIKIDVKNGSIRIFKPGTVKNTYFDATAINRIFAECMYDFVEQEREVGEFDMKDFTEESFGNFMNVVEMRLEDRNYHFEQQMALSAAKWARDDKDLKNLRKQYKQEKNEEGNSVINKLTSGNIHVIGSPESPEGWQIELRGDDGETLESPEFSKWAQKVHDSFDAAAQEYGENKGDFVYDTKNIQKIAQSSHKKKFWKRDYDENPSKEDPVQDTQELINRQLSEIDENLEVNEEGIICIYDDRKEGFVEIEDHYLQDAVSAMFDQDEKRFTDLAELNTDLVEELEAQKYNILEPINAWENQFEDILSEQYENEQEFEEALIELNKEISSLEQDEIEPAIFISRISGQEKGSKRVMILNEDGSLTCYTLDNDQFLGNEIAELLVNSRENPALANDDVINEFKGALQANGALAEDALKAEFPRAIAGQPPVSSRKGIGVNGKEIVTVSCNVADGVIHEKNTQYLSLGVPGIDGNDLKVGIKFKADGSIEMLDEAYILNGNSYEKSGVSINGPECQAALQNMAISVSCVGPNNEINYALIIDGQITTTKSLAQNHDSDGVGTNLNDKALRPAPPAPDVDDEELGDDELGLDISRGGVDPDDEREEGDDLDLTTSPLFGGDSLDGEEDLGAPSPEDSVSPGGNQGKDLKGKGEAEPESESEAEQEPAVASTSKTGGNSDSQETPTPTPSAAGGPDGEKGLTHAAGGSSPSPSPVSPGENEEKMRRDDLPLPESAVGSEEEVARGEEEGQPTPPLGPPSSSQVVVESKEMEDAAAVQPPPPPGSPFDHIEKPPPPPGPPPPESLASAAAQDMTAQLDEREEELSSSGKSLMSLGQGKEQKKELDPREELNAALDVMSSSGKASDAAAAAKWVVEHRESMSGSVGGEDEVIRAEDGSLNYNPDESDRDATTEEDISPAPHDKAPEAAPIAVIHEDMQQPEAHVIEVSSPGGGSQDNKGPIKGSFAALRDSNGPNLDEQDWQYEEGTGGDHDQKAPNRERPRSASFTKALEVARENEKSEGRVH